MPPLAHPLHFNYQTRTLKHADGIVPLYYVSVLGTIETDRLPFRGRLSILASIAFTRPANSGRAAVAFVPALAWGQPKHPK